MKYFFISDIHGYFDKMIKKLNEVNFDLNNKNHTLCIAGDFFDNGPQQIELFDWIKEYYEKGKILLVKGNHDILHSKEWEYYDLQMEKELKKIYKKQNNIKTFKSFVRQKCDEIRIFINMLPYFIEKDNFILVHAGINPSLPDWRLGPKEGCAWTDSMTWMCYEHALRIKEGLFKNFGKKVIAGHNWVEKLHFFEKNGFFPYEKYDFNNFGNNEIFQKDDFICVDGKWNESSSKGLAYIMEDK